MDRRLITLALLAALMCVAGPAPAGAATSATGSVSVRAAIPELATSGLTCGPQPFDPTRGRATFSFTLSRPAVVLVWIANWSGGLVNIQLLPSTAAGLRTASWNGRDLLGNLVAPSWYTFTVAAVTGQAQTQTPLQVAVTYGPALRMMAGGVRPATFRPPATTTFSSTLSRAAFVGVRITSSRGVVVRTVPEAFSPSGTFSYAWNGRDDAGRVVAVGAYTGAFTGRDSGGNAASVSQTVTVR
jgi:flagellar hook assembly protein FlgD